MKSNNIVYEKLDYDVFNKRINDSLKDERLIKLGISKNPLGYTFYGYELFELTIGSGKHDLFIVGGTHGSEIIGVDFVTQLINNIPNLEDYDPNLLTIHIIPNQNPEGYDITTQTMKDINNDNLNKESYDYYLRYRIDNLINNYLKVLDKKFNNIKDILITPEIFINTIKESFKDTSWSNIIDSKRGIKELYEYQNIFNNLVSYDNYNDLFKDIKIRIYNLSSRVSNPYFKTAINRLGLSLFSDELMNSIITKNYIYLNKNVGSRLYQDKFKDIDITNTKSEELSKHVSEIFNKMNIPKGSQIKFDPNGNFVNLNKNRVDNKGILDMLNNNIIYGITPSNNILDNTDGPIGKPTIDANNFTYSYENIVLKDLLDKSYEKGRLLGTILYHSTGGVIYSKPHDDTDRVDLLTKYNNALAEAYVESSDYKIVKEGENTGYGDYLRSTFPGVLLIELSKMGGNPIGPYGDTNNYNLTIDSNIKAVNDLIKRCNEIILNNEVIEPSNKI